MLTFGLIFWIMMLIWAIYAGWGFYAPAPYWMYGNGLFIFVLFLLLGWHVFGQPIRP
jgi:hypothetical protein